MIAAKNLHRAARAFGACCVLVALAAVSSATWAQAGYLYEVSGKVSIQRASDKARPAKAGDTFETDTIFRTGSDGRAILKFADGQLATLGVESVLHVGQYRYDAGNLRLSVSTMELMKGEMRLVAGLIGTASRERMRITAGNSMISIQKPGGADFTVAVNPDPQEVGYAVVALGEISVHTPYGPIYSIAAGQYAPWRPGRTPPLPLPVAAAPAVVQAAAAAFWATVLPTDAPVVVASAARMALATAAAGPASAVVGADSRPAGYVEAISNTVFVQKASGRAVTAHVGDIFQAGTTFNTGAEGRVVLKFADGQVAVLGPGSILGVEQYQFDPNNVRASRTAIELLNGAMRYITGVIHADNHEGVSISAGASVIDILNRGFADFTLVVNTREQEVGLAAVAAGEIAVHTPYGLIGKVTRGEAAPWQPGQASLRPEPLARAPGAIQAQVAALAATMLPENTPVAVAPAATAAAALAAKERAQAAANADPGNAQLRAAAQTAAERANAASQTAAAATQSVAATLFETVLAGLPAAAAGPAQARVATAAAAPPGAAIPTIPAVTPGAGGGCTGSRC